MSVVWGLLAPLAAAGILVLVMQLAVYFVAQARDRDYARQESKGGTDIAAHYAVPGLPAVARSPQSAVFSELFLAVHRKAIFAQNLYHAAVVRSGACLVTAFCAIALSTTGLNAIEPLHLVLVWLDVLAMAFLLYNFKIGAHANEQWITQRIEAELLRQYQFIARLFPSLNPPGREPASQFEAESALVRANVLKDVKGTETIARIDAFWADRRKQIAQSKPGAADFSAVALLLYLHKRPLRQLRWFRDSRARLEHNAHSRARRLVWLFGTALLLAVLKLLIALFGSHDPVAGHEAANHGIVSWVSVVVLPALLVVTGWSAAEAAYYLNQNSRSLIHRYDAQLKRMAQWFSRITSALPIADLATVELDPAMKEQALALVLEFEDLMIEELNDWIHISKTDAIELSP